MSWEASSAVYDYAELSPRYENPTFNGLKGHEWYYGWQVDSLRAIAAREGVSKIYAGDAIKLAFLSPKSVEAIVAGRQPAELVSNHLLIANLPLSWAEQEHLFNF
jgi:hypothetical protein